ncbi:MAG: HD domain-containing phosphohydrolase [Polyangiaceae bacterium]
MAPHVPREDNGNREAALSAAEAWSKALDHLELGTRTHARFASVSVTRPHALVLMATKGNHANLVVPAVVWDAGATLLGGFAHRIADGTALVTVLGRPVDTNADVALKNGLGGVVPKDATPEEVVIAAERAFELMEARGNAEHRGQWLRRYRYELGELVNIARAMTTERNVDKLLGIILEKCRFITGADAGSIYVVEADDKQGLLRFKLTQNDSVSFDSREFTIPVSNRSIAGTAALEKRAINVPDVYQLPPGSTFRVDRSFDEKIGYRTKSMLVAPLISQQGDVIGVIQLINKKKEPQKKLLSKEDVDAEVLPFDDRSEELLGMLSAQAGASLETAMLYDEIRRLFEGFVRASVEAIESRDPTTSGHSRRVADLTVGLAKAVDIVGSGPYREASFTREDLRELEYASLLHDFGKIGVREKVLVKAKKLYDEELEVIRARFDYVARSLEASVLARKVEALEKRAPQDVLTALDLELSKGLSELEVAFAAIVAANEPTVLSSGDFAKVEAIASESFSDRQGTMRTLLTPSEVVALSVKRGSLTPEEFDEIRSHVSHTYRFLSQIPWGKAFRRVPLIAGAHHERLNGTGYPNRLKAEEIPVQSKMMSIADIYDALTASDRPYKKAIPVERAIDILDFNVKDGHLDAELVRIFREARVWEPGEPGSAG